jgi:hypothetical protein
MCLSAPLTMANEWIQSPLAFVITGVSLFVFAPRLCAQFVVQLKPATLNAFEQYAKSVEAGLHERWSGKKPFLLVSESPAELQRMFTGDLAVHPASGTQPVPVSDGLIHDWTGTILFPHTTLERVVALLENFESHKNIYPQVADSRTLHRHGNDVTGYWRLHQKGLVPVTFAVEQDAHYEQVAPGKWTGRAYARHIAEINPSLFAHGREYPLGEGHGYLWRLYSYWSLEAQNGGVLAECRTLSLSRDIPEGLAWAVGPYIKKMPEDSLESTLKATRQALQK